MIWLIILDFLMFSLTFYHFHFVIIGIPFLKKIDSVVVYFWILCFYDIRFLINLAVVLLFFGISKRLNTKINKNVWVKIGEALFYYTVYMLIFKLLGIN